MSKDLRGQSTFMTNYFYGDKWETEGKKSIDFSVKNFVTLKNYLDKKNIKLLVMLYPWSFEMVDKIPRENYLNYIIPLLEREKINYISAYEHFFNLDGDIYSNIADNYVYNDVHFSKQGYKILSNIIWEDVIKNYKLEN